MNLVRYPDKARLDPLADKYVSGIAARGPGVRTFLYVEANKATLHFAADAVSPASSTLLLPTGTIAPEDAPASAERGLCALSGEPVFAVIGPSGSLAVDSASPRKLVAGDWIIGKVEWVRKPT
ncbi:hypothetical protein ACNPON_17830 [Glutamicibacter sp. AGC13]